MARAQPGPWVWDHDQKCVVDLLLRPVDFCFRSSQERVLDLQDITNKLQEVIDKQNDEIADLKKEMRVVEMRAMEMRAMENAEFE